MNEPSTSIVAQVAANPVMVLTDEQTYTRFYQGIMDEVNAHVPDTTTDKGRKAIAALAYKVTRTKTAIDAAGKSLNEEARARINTVDAQRRKIREELEAAAEMARKPLTEWEVSEAHRLDTIKRRIAHIEAVGRGFIGPDLHPFGLLFHELDHKVILDEAHFGEFLPEAQRTHATARANLVEEQARQTKEAADRAELERLRAAETERQRKDAEIERARIVQAQKEAEERSLAEAAQQQRERIQREEQAKAANAVREAEERAAAQQREYERAQKAEADKAAAAIKQAEDRAKAAEEIVQQQARETEEAARREAQEKAAREADREHRGKLMGECKQALGALGIDEETARKVVLAVIANEIPHVKFQF